MNRFLLMAFILWVSVINISAESKSPIEGTRDCMVIYGINPVIGLNTGIIQTYHNRNKSTSPGTGWFLTTEEGIIEATEDDENLLYYLAKNRQSLRESLIGIDYPIETAEGESLTYAYFDDASATLTYFYKYDENLYDMNEMLRLGSAVSKVIMKKKLKQNKSFLDSLILSFANLKYKYIGDKTGLTCEIFFTYDELEDLEDDEDK